MNEVNHQEFIDEIIYASGRKDNIKTSVTLSYICQVDLKTQKRAMFELSRAEDSFVIPFLAGFIVKHPDIVESVPLIYESFLTKILDNQKMLLELLNDDEKILERPFLAEVAGNIGLEGSIPVLLKIINSGADDKTLEAVIMALGAMRAQVACIPISEYLYSGNRSLIIAAINSLGQLASPTALQRLKERIGTDNELDIMVINALAHAQVPEALEKINDLLGSHYAHLRTEAKQKLIEIGAKAVPILINNLLHDDPDLLIHSLNVLGAIGDEDAIPAVKHLIHNEPEDPNVRFAAYEALGMLPVSKGAYILAAGLQDPVDNVRAAAASAINSNFDTLLSAGLKNMIKNEGTESEIIIHTIVDSLCDKVFTGLLESQYFKNIAINYLAFKAHPDVRTFFVKILVKNGFDDLADQITKEKKTEIKNRLKVYAVDDSRMVLSIYRRVLHNLDCDPVLFEFPAQALEQIKKEKPDIVFTDLNMPDISGIELTKSIRQLFGESELPVIMVTTQNEALDNEAALGAGVNTILQKPFTEEQIGIVLKGYL